MKKKDNQMTTKALKKVKNMTFAYIRHNILIVMDFNDVTDGLIFRI